MNAQLQNYAPGARLVIRDTEWVLRRVDLSSDGGYQLTCDGISELVHGQTNMFLTQIEDDIQTLDPAKTQLEQDLSDKFAQGLLYIESQLRQAIPNDESIHLAQHAAMDLVPYQIDPTVQALKQPRQRILIADAVGLGKTLEAGILVTELMQRGRGKRMLVLTLKSMMTQFQKEFWNRFTIPLTRLDSAGLQRVRQRIPGNHNPFYYFDKSIISIDTLKQDNEFKGYLEKAYWDIIVIDEAHNVADRGTSSQRAALAQLLASRSDTLIMLSATPHDGKARSFASLMNMLDPTAIANPEQYAKEDFHNKGLVIRRFKKDIREQVETEFKERQVHCLKHPASLEEETAYDALLAVPFTYKGKFDPEKQGHLIRIGLQKALFSSPAACLSSVNERIAKLENTLSQNEPQNEDIHTELNALQSLKLALQNINVERNTKYQNFIQLLKNKAFDWKKTNTNDRLVIFSERLETLKFLEKQLKQDLKLNDAQITQLHGGLSDVDQQKIVETFGKPETKLRVLLCSDVASEGINLHYLSHRLIHFDLPWSLMVFQQRNGRVDRYGQEETPHIYYLITESENQTIRGDTRILEILQQKDEQAYKNIGDPATFMKVHDVDAEEQLTEKAMAEGMEAQVFDQTYQADESNEGDELFALFFSTEEAAPSALQQLPLAERQNLFASDYVFAKAAIQYLNRDRQLMDASFSDSNQTFSLIAPDDLRHHFRYLPPEIRPEKWEQPLILTADKKQYQNEVKRSRQDESAWPKQHYLWAQHPVMQWLQERMLANVGRHTAPVLALNSELQPGQSIFLVSGLIPNRKAHPVIWHWYAVHCDDGKVTSVEDMHQTLKQLQLGRKPLPNSGQPVELEKLLALRGPVIEAAKQQVLQARNEFDTEMQVKLAAQTAELQRLRELQQDQLELALSTSRQDTSFKEARRLRESKRIDDIFKQYQTWVEETLNTEPMPYMQIIGVITRAHQSPYMSGEH
ncbi:putative ATP-dependent helicase [hydrothermal vent metagenome]|uniref:Putative ATP-dependent helicase n=1 Tax=hydrothermal vent metagenome TaxID=652676 RepID=A0A3B0ZB49_9ZZZZ